METAFRVLVFLILLAMVYFIWWEFGYRVYRDDHNKTLWLVFTTILCFAASIIYAIIAFGAPFSA